MSQHTLDLGMLQELIAFASRHDMNVCQKDLGHHRGIAILSIEADQSHLG
jgi:hypothetical protein